MGLGNFARVHVQAYAADDMVKDLADLNVDLKAKLDHEHNQRVREKADAKVAVMDARSKAAIDLAETKADFEVAIEEAEARGEAIGFQRAMRETELFDAGFQGGRRQGRGTAVQMQSQSTSFRQRQVEPGPALSMSNGSSLERKGTSTTSLNQPPAYSERSRRSAGLRRKNSSPPISMSASLRKHSSHDSNTGSARSSNSGVKHTQYDNGSKASSHRANFESFHSQGPGSRKSKYEADLDISYSHNSSNRFSREGLNLQRGSCHVTVFQDALIALRFMGGKSDTMNAQSSK